MYDWSISLEIGKELDMKSMQKTIAAVMALTAFTISADTWTDNAGYTWSYDVSGSAATITGVSPATGDVVIPSKIAGYSVTRIGEWAFSFRNGNGLVRVTIPDSVSVIESSAFEKYSGVVVCKGEVPWMADITGISPLEYEYFRGTIVMPRNCAQGYAKGMNVPLFGGYIDAANQSHAKVISSSIRENDPTVMDVVYKVISDKPTVKIRALAFEDGERSFANMIRPETFVDGTAPIDWDAVEANVEHTLSWKVSGDWATRLAKVKFEILTCEGDLLPLELMTIPASDKYGKMKISWNALSADQVNGALMWLYADKTQGLTLENGILKYDGKVLFDRADFHDRMEFIFRKMGFDGALSGEMLEYVNDETRLQLGWDGGFGLAHYYPFRVNQYAYKILGE